MLPAPLVDGFGRRHASLRISVTDRCNIRCFYCMPAENVRFLPRAQLLTFEEIVRLVSALQPLGVDKLRLTGGEPLLRANLAELVRLLSDVQGIADLALTTNGILLAEQAEELKKAGLRRLNISLDSLRPEMFEKISRRQGLDRVLAGIAMAQDVGFEAIRLNAVAIRGLTEDDVIPLVEFARERNLVVRFIEYMPLDALRQWEASDVLTGAQIRSLVESHFGPLLPTPRSDPARPATDYDFSDRRGGLGLISPVSEPFCGDCDRLRVTAEGQLRNCLFSTTEWDARRMLREGCSDSQLQDLVRECVGAKRASHGIGEPLFERPMRAMYQIGG